MKIDVNALLRDRAAETEEAEGYLGPEFESIVDADGGDELPELTPSFVSPYDITRNAVASMSTTPAASSSSKKRKSPSTSSSDHHRPPAKKKAVTTTSTLGGHSATGHAPLSITLKMPEPYPCCLCPSLSKEGLLKVHDPPPGLYGGMKGISMAHEDCALVVPETWIDDLMVPDGMGGWAMERRVCGIRNVVKDRWNLVSLVVWNRLGSSS